MAAMWTAEKVRKCVAKHHTKLYSWDVMANGPFRDVRKAAILIPLVIQGGKLFVWLTKRAAHLRNDRGVVAFPGGMRDPGDRDEAFTSLRESQEEIGLDRHQVTILGQLLPRIGKRQGTSFVITPVVGIVDPNFEPRISEEEVEVAFRLPLERFLCNDGHSSMTYTNRGFAWLSHHFDDVVEGKFFKTFGLTADLCVQIAMVMFNREPEFPWDSSTGGGGDTLENPFSQQENFVKRFEQQKREELLNMNSSKL